MADVGPGGPEASAASGQDAAAHGASTRVDDRHVPSRVFLGIGILITVLGAIYAATAYEEAGIVLLFVAAILGLWCGAYLWLQLRQRRVPSDRRDRPGPASPGGAAAQESAAIYLPHASAWPFVMGLGGALAINGLVLGIWVLVPGAGLLALGVGGFIQQTRRRD